MRVIPSYDPIRSFIPVRLNPLDFSNTIPSERIGPSLFDFPVTRYLLYEMRSSLSYGAAHLPIWDKVDRVAKAILFLPYVCLFEFCQEIALSMLFIFDVATHCLFRCRLVLAEHQMPAENDNFLAAQTASLQVNCSEKPASREHVDRLTEALRKVFAAMNTEQRKEYEKKIQDLDPDLFLWVAACGIAHALETGQTEWIPNFPRDLAEKFQQLDDRAKEATIRAVQMCQHKILDHNDVLQRIASITYSWNQNGSFHSLCKASIASFSPS